MTLQEITEELLKIHRKYSNNSHSNEDSQMCNLWSTDNPPDVLENTPQLLAIEDALDMAFEEEEAVEFYDMCVGDAAVYIFDLKEITCNDNP